MRWSRRKMEDSNLFDRSSEMGFGSGSLGFVHGQRGGVDVYRKGGDVLLLALILLRVAVGADSARLSRSSKRGKGQRIRRER